MADPTTITGDSVEAIAFALLRIIAIVENRSLSGNPVGGQTHPDREWILTTYAQCWQVAKGGKPSL
jgi:hypothetical protein